MKHADRDSPNIADYLIGKKLPDAVRSTIEFCEFVFWDILMSRTELNVRNDGYTSISSSTWHDKVENWLSSNVIVDAEYISLMLKSLRAMPEFFCEKNENLSLGPNLHNPEAVIAALNYHIKSKWTRTKPTVMMFLWPYIRSKYHLHFDTTLAAFHSMADLIEDKAPSASGQAFWIAPQELWPLLESIEATQNTKLAFILACRILKIIHVRLVLPPTTPESTDPQKANITPANSIAKLRMVVEPNIDAEFVICQLFGHKTSITGLDQLFGGGGILLGFSDSFANELQHSPPIPGRAVLVSGQFGAGKTTLSLSLAAAVAKAGGIAWYFPLEAAADECKMQLETLGLLQSSGPAIRILDTEQLINEYLCQIENGSDESKDGSIIIASASKKSFKDLLDDVLQSIALTDRRAGCRSFFIDPINSVLDLSDHNHRELRADLMSTIQTIKRKGVNLIIASETELLPSQNLDFVQNVADTVISLESDNTTHGYSQRYIRILKSRLQREQRGLHPFSIKAGRGIELYPSSAAVAARIRNRRNLAAVGSSLFGWDDLDSKLGSGAFSRGDVIVVEGDSGCLKTQIGLIFARGSEFDKYIKTRDATRTLVLALGDRKSSINSMVNGASNLNWSSTKEPSLRHKSNSRLIFREGLAAGFIQPGKIFDQIEDAFDDCVAGTLIDRVWVDNFWRWERTCPSIRADETFGQTLVEYLRKQRATSIFTCRDIDHGPGLQRSIVDLATVHIKLRRIDYRGHNLLLAKIMKTRSMLHYKEYFTLEYDGSSLWVSERGNLLAFDSDEKLRTLNAALYFHFETDQQSEYLHYVTRILRPLLGTEVNLKGEDRTALITARSQSTTSTFEELQLIQLDEFQAPNDGKPDSQFHTWDQQIIGDGVYKEMLIGPSGSRGASTKELLSVLPYYNNIGLLVVDRRCLSMSLLNDSANLSWADLNELISPFQSGGRPAFSFCRVSSESSACWFLEILLCHLKKSSISITHENILDVLCASDSGFQQILREVCYLYRTLARKSSCTKNQATKQELNSDPPSPIPAVASRQWFSTIGAYYTSIPERDREHYEVIGLPGHIGVSGEWYLGVPISSPAANSAKLALKFLVSDAEQINRLRNGVGLPTKPFLLGSSKFTLTKHAAIPTAAIEETVHNSFRRSSIPAYARFSPVLTFHLQRLTEIAESKETLLEECISILANDIRAIVSSQHSN